MKTRLTLLTALLTTAATFSASGERQCLRDVLRLKTESGNMTNARPQNSGIPLRNVPGTSLRLPIVKKAAIPAMRLTSTGAELLGYLSYSDNMDTPRGLYEFESRGPELRWTDPMWEDEDVKGSLKTSWINNGRICGYSYQIIWGQLWNNRYAEYDLETGEPLDIRELEISQDGQPAVMQVAAYDLSEGLLFGYGQLYGGYAFMTADPENPDTFNMVRPVDFAEICSSLCYNQYEDALYGINQNHEFVAIDARGDQKVIFTLPFEDAGSYVTGLAYNPLENVYYWNMIDGQGNASMARLNPADGTAEISETLPDGYTFCTLYCLDDKMDPRRPRRPQSLGTDFPDGVTTGKVRFLLPSETMTGKHIDNDLNYTAWLDGDRYSEGTAAADTELTVEYSGLSDAMHTFGLTVSYEGVESSISQTRAYVGNDTPVAPQGVTMNTTTVSWEPVTQGIHGGWIDLAAMRYEVYINGEAAGETSDTSLEVILPSDKPLELYKAAVKAICNDMESQLSGESNGVVAGEPMAIPVYLEPTPEEFGLMSYYDSNSNGWYIVDIEGGYVVCPFASEGQQDNWLFLPPFRIEDASKLYTFSFDAFTWAEWYEEEYAEVLLCTAPSPENVISTVIDEINPDETPTNHSGLIHAPAPGSYYIALHCTSSEWQLGVLARNFRITDDNVLLSSPDKPVHLKASAAPEGKLEATVSFEMPTTSIGGGLLPDDAELTAKISSVAGKAVATGKPGEHVSAVVATEQGDNLIEVTVSDAVSNGRTATTNVYTGVEIPGDITSPVATPSADMMSVRLEWQAPQEGTDGGYIVPQEVTYDIYRYEQNYIGWYWQVYAQDVKGTEFTYTAAPEDPQSLVQLGIASKNAAGTSGNIVVVSALVGMPYGLPVNEDFENPYGLSFQPWLPYAPSAEYDSQIWEINYLDYYDDSLQTGAIGLVGTTMQDNSRGMLGFPRFSTANCGDVSLSITVLNSPEMPRLTLSGQYYGSEAVEIGSIQPSSGKGLATYTFRLPAGLLGKEWLQIYLTVDFATAGQLVYIEDVAIQDIGSEIDSATECKYSITGDERGIRLLGLDGCMTHIATLDGRSIFNGIIRGNDAHIPADKGLYMVKAGSMIAKILVF